MQVNEARRLNRQNVEGISVFYGILVQIVTQRIYAFFKVKFSSFRNIQNIDYQQKQAHLLENCHESIQFLQKFDKKAFESLVKYYKNILVIIFNNLISSYFKNLFGIVVISILHFFILNIDLV